MDLWHRQRQSFGDLADVYDRTRPEWPAPTAAWLTGSELTGSELTGSELTGSELTGSRDAGPLASRAPLDVLDLGAGTGKLTRTLVAAGHRVTAIDASPGMLDVLARGLPQVRTVVAPAEALPLPAASLDVITVAQAWHWFDQAAVAAECARVLRPGGLLAVAWHLEPNPLEAGSPAGPPWLAELADLAGRPESSRHGSVTAAVAAGFPGPFEPVQSRTFSYELRLSPAGLAALASSWSYVAVRDDCAQVLDAVLALGRRVAGASGMLVLPFTTFCFRAHVRRPADAGSLDAGSLDAGSLDAGSLDADHGGAS